MARTFTGSTSVYLSYTGVVGGTLPFTMAAWVNPTSTASAQCAMSITVSGGFDYFTMNISASAFVLASSAQGGVPNSAQSSSTISTSAWHHVCAVFTGTTSRAVYLDGGSKGTNAGSSNPAGLNRSNIGVRVGSTLSDPFNGRIAEATTWNVSLTDAEVLALSKGVSSLNVRPSAVVGYWPLWGISSPEQDVSPFNHGMTLTGTPAAGNHAPVRLFTWTIPNAPLIEVAAATGGPFPFFMPQSNDVNFSG